LAVEKAAKDLKGKKYVFDRDGQPIAINAVKGDDLPPFLMPVKLHVKSVPSAEEVAEAGAKAAKEKSKGSKGNGELKKREKGLRVAGARGIEVYILCPVYV
jgi:hypothetical protein